MTFRIYLKTFVFQEFPFFTITKFPAGFLRHIGGVVTARSVKLLDKINHPGTKALVK